MGYLIRHIATSFSGDIFAAAEFEKVVYIWSFQDLKRLNILDTKLDFGGRRLAISSQGNLCAVGAYKRYGIAMYDVIRDQMLWNNKELKQIQRLKFNQLGDKLYACFDHKAIHVINSQTGEIIEKIGGAENIWFSQYGYSYLIEGNDLNIYDIQTKKSLIINRETFGVLDVKFSNSICFISEAGGPIRAISMSEGNVMWKINIDDNHFLRIGFNEEKDVLYAVLCPYVNGGNKVLFEIDKQTGNLLGKTELEQDVGETEFIKNASFLVCSNGNVYELRRERPSIINKISWI